MVGERYRTVQETIEYFRTLAYDFEVIAHRADNSRDKWYALGKAEAYSNAAFEIEHNLKK